MKRTTPYLVGIFLFFAAGAFAQSFQTGIGADFFNYDRTFLDLRAAYLQPLKQDVELSLGASFAIATEKKDGDVEADFFIPLDGGVNFLFRMNDKFGYLFGLGVSVQFLLESERRLYVGPFVKGGVRVKTHPYMTWYFEAQQDLVIGEPDWINNSTRLNTGIIFSL